MADQVNPLGSLTAGVLQTLQVASKPPSAKPEKANDAASADPRARKSGSRPMDASSEEIDAAAKEIKEYLKNSQSNLHFSMDKDTGSVVFKVINSSTGEVIRQVPAEEILVMARKLRQLSEASDSSGVLLDEKG